MMVSKRVAVDLYGVKEVAEFINAQILDGQRENNANKTELWERYRDLVPSAPYNVLEETDRLVQEYKPKLLELSSDIDFSNPQWWI
jgi:hypothetical protein